MALCVEIFGVDKQVSGTDLHGRDHDDGRPPAMLVSGFREAAFFVWEITSR